MKHSIRILLYIVGITVLLVAIYLAHTRVRAQWQEVALRQALLQDVPAQTSHTAALKKELEVAEQDMRGVYSTIPTKDGLVDVISAISSAALSTGISAQVPTVEETKVSPVPVPSVSASPGPVPSGGSLSDVHIHIVASGKVPSLASFLYRVEHLPYVLRIVSWEIDTTQQTAVGSLTSIVPEDGEKVTLPPLGSSLKAHIVIAVREEQVTP